VIASADFFTTEVWTRRGLVTYYTVFVIDLASRRVHIVGSTPHPNEWVPVDRVRHAARKVRVRRRLWPIRRGRHHRLRRRAREANVGV
jgi:hypothetical protein